MLISLGGLQKEKRATTSSRRQPDRLSRFFNHAILANTASTAWSFFPAFPISGFLPRKPPPIAGTVLGACGLQEFGFSREDFLPGFRQLQRYQTSADESGEGQEDGDDLSDANKGCKDEAGDDGRKLADAIQDAKRCPSAGWKRGRKIKCRILYEGLVSWEVLSFYVHIQRRSRAHVATVFQQCERRMSSAK